MSGVFLPSVQDATQGGGVCDRVLVYSGGAAVGVCTQCVGEDEGLRRWVYGIHSF